MPWEVGGCREGELHIPGKSAHSQGRRHWNCNPSPPASLPGDRTEEPCAENRHHQCSLFCLVMVYQSQWTPSQSFWWGPGFQGSLEPSVQSWASFPISKPSPTLAPSGGCRHHIQMLTTTVGLSDPEVKAAECPLIPKVIWLQSFLPLPLLNVLVCHTWAEASNRTERLASLSWLLPSCKRNHLSSMMAQERKSLNWDHTMQNCLFWMRGWWT